MNFERFCRDHGIRIAPTGHHHYRTGWVCVPCPFCTGHSGYHLGYSARKDFFTCFRCGWHKPAEVVMALLGSDWKDAKKELEAYDGHVRMSDREITHAVTLKLPVGTAGLDSCHFAYVSARGYDESRLRVWGLLGTSFYGAYRFRVIAPIVFHGRMVSYQGRDITGKQKLRWKACAETDEVIHHKNIVYGYDQIKGGTAVITEGMPNVWRLGPGSLATFGSKVTTSQVALLAEIPRRIVWFDNDEAGKTNGEKLANLLASFPGQTDLVSYPEVKDPGELPQDEADDIMRELLR